MHGCEGGPDSALTRLRPQVDSTIGPKGSLQSSRARFCNSLVRVSAILSCAFLQFSRARARSLRLSGRVPHAPYSRRALGVSCRAAPTFIPMIQHCPSRTICLLCYLARAIHNGHNADSYMATSGKHVPPPPPPPRLDAQRNGWRYIHTLLRLHPDLESVQRTWAPSVHTRSVHTALMIRDANPNKKLESTSVTATLTVQSDSICIWTLE